jgi:PEP-CTERM motif-containing protein
MRRYDKWIRAVATGAAALVIAWCGSAFAAPPQPATITISLDEKGNSMVVIVNSGGQTSTTTVTGVSAADPGLGGLSNALTFSLGSVTGGLGSLTPGDLLLFEGAGCVATLVDGAACALSDVIRFETIGTVPTIVFYSDIGDGTESGVLADTGLPTCYANFPDDTCDVSHALAVEIGLEGTNGAVYQPTSGGVGDFTGHGPTGITTYNITSDAPGTTGNAPEPATLALLGLGLGALGFSNRRKLMHQVRVHRLVLRKA